MEEHPDPDAPHPGKRRPSPGRPHAAPTARKAISQGQARPQGGERPKARQGDEGSGPSPPKLNRGTMGLRQETWRGASHLERPY